MLVGVLATPLLIAAIAPGFTGEQARADDRASSASCFPGAGLLVLSAWCLGVLNSHHRFLLSYTRAGDVERRDDRDAGRSSAPGTTLPRLAVMLAWGSVVGSALQFVVQLPVVLRVAPDLRFALDTDVGARADDRRATSCRCSSAAASCR